MNKKRSTFVVSVSAEMLAQEGVGTEGLIRHETRTDTFVIPTPKRREVKIVKEKARVVETGGDTPQEFTTGTVTRVPAWILRKAITSLRSMYPNVEVLNQMYVLMEGRVEEDYRDEVGKFIPLVFINLIPYKGEEITGFLLWMIACYWYQYAHGPRPDTAPVIREKPVSDDVLWAEKLVCPLCNHRYEGKVDTADRTKTMTAFTKWLSVHAKTCQQPVMSRRKAKLTSAQVAERESELQAKALAYNAIVSQHNKELQSLALKEIRKIRDEKLRDKLYEQIIHAQQSVVAELRSEEALKIQRSADREYCKRLEIELREYVEAAQRRLENQPLPERVPSVDEMVLEAKLREAVNELTRLENIYGDSSLLEFQKILENAYPANIERAKKLVSQLRKKLQELKGGGTK